MARNKKLRPMGRITEDLEKLLFEMMDDHDMQFHEVLGMIFFWTQVHMPGAIEEYEDGSTPKISYGSDDR